MIPSAERVALARLVELQRADSAVLMPPAVVSLAMLVALSADQKRSFVDEFAWVRQLDCWPVQH